MKHVTRIAFALLMATCTAPAFHKKHLCYVRPMRNFNWK